MKNKLLFLKLIMNIQLHCFVAEFKKLIDRFSFPPKMPLFTPSQKVRHRINAVVSFPEKVNQM